MATGPRSSGTDSLDTFRQELNKVMPRADSSAADADEEEAVRRRLPDVLPPGRPVPVGKLALTLGVPTELVCRALRLPPDTSPEQTVVRNEPARTPTTKRRKPASGAR